MQTHDWKRVPAGIFHHFHNAWIMALSDALNAGLLPDDFYALAEQHMGGFGPDVLTLEAPAADDGDSAPDRRPDSQGGLLLAPPQTHFAGETDMAFYRRKQKMITVRHISDDNLVAVIEIVSPGNKSGKLAFAAFLEKAAALLDQRIHLLIIDLHPPGSRDPGGIHAAIWESITDEPYTPPAGKPLTLASYEADAGVRAYVEHVAVGDPLPDMPLFLQPGGHIETPLADTYAAAFNATPRRWRAELQ